MEKVVSSYGTLVMLVFNMFLCIAMNTVSIRTAEAKEYKASVIAEIENSNFNPNVIAACETQAQSAGYELDIINCQYDENNFISSAEVVLSYSYNIPVFNVTETKSTRGIAR